MWYMVLPRVVQVDCRGISDLLESFSVAVLRGTHVNGKIQIHDGLGWKSITSSPESPGWGETQMLH